MKFKLKLLVVIFATLFVLEISKAQDTNPSQRLTPTEIDAVAPSGAGAGTSG